MRFAMSGRRVIVPLVGVCLSAAACTLTVPSTDPEPADSDPPVRLDVPPGQFPPLGQCRIWIPGRPPGRQERARSCDEIESGAPAGAWILQRPSGNRRIVRVRYVHATRAGVVVRIRLFDAATRRFLREERSSRSPHDAGT